MNRLALIFAVIFALVGSGALWLASRHADYAGKLTTEGVATDAEIVAKQVRKEVTKTRMVGDNRPDSVGHDVNYVRYRFRLENGDAFEKEESVEPDFYEQAEVGSVWRVTYWPGDPETASLYGERFSQSAGLLHWIAGIALTLSALLFAYRFRRRLFDRAR